MVESKNQKTSNSDYCLCTAPINENSNMRHKSDNRYTLHCNFCRYTNVQRKKIKQHIKVAHDSIKSFKCEKCFFRFSNSYALHLHMNAIHNNIKDQSCSMCPSICASKGALKKHIE